MTHCHCGEGFQDEADPVTWNNVLGQWEGTCAACSTECGSFLTQTISAIDSDNEARLSRGEVGLGPARRPTAVTRLGLGLDPVNCSRLPTHGTADPMAAGTHVGSALRQEVVGVVE